MLGKGSVYTIKNIVAKMSPARPTKPAAIPPTMAEVLALLVGAPVALAVAEEELLEGCIGLYVIRVMEVTGCATDAMG